MKRTSIQTHIKAPSIKHTSIQTHNKAHKYQTHSTNTKYGTHKYQTHKYQTHNKVHKQTSPVDIRPLVVCNCGKESDTSTETHIKADKHSNTQDSTQAYRNCAQKHRKHTAALKYKKVNLG